MRGTYETLGLKEILGERFIATKQSNTKYLLKDRKRENLHGARDTNGTINLNLILRAREIPSNTSHKIERNNPTKDATRNVRDS